MSSGEDCDREHSFEIPTASTTAPNFVDLATTLENLGARWLLEKKLISSILLIFRSVMTSSVLWIKREASASMHGQNASVTVITARTNQVRSVAQVKKWLEKKTSFKVREKTGNFI